jgi:manganese peroxidase
MVGRVDATVAGPENKLPAPNATADDSIKLFSAQGFTVDDLTALLGAHTTSKQFATVPAKAGAPQDTTPTEWDILYYSETIAGTAPVTFIADANLVADPRSAPSFKQFASDKPGWDAAFASAMARLERLGNGKGANIDCTAALGAMPTKRDLGSAPLFGAMLHKHKRSASGSGGHYHSWH